MEIVEFDNNGETQFEPGFDPIIHEMIVLQRESLQDTWSNVYIQYLVCRAIEKDFPLHWGRVWRAEQSTHQAFAEDLADALLVLGASQTKEDLASIDPDTVIHSLLTFSGTHLHYLYGTSMRGVREREYSYFHRFSCLCYQTQEVYRHLITLGAQESIDTLRLAMIVAIRSKEDLRNNYESNVDYCLIPAQFCKGHFDFSKYKSTAIYRRFDYSFRLKYLSDQVLIRDTYLNLDADTRRILSHTRVYTLPVTYDEVFREYMGFNDRECRPSYNDLASQWGSTPETFQSTVDLVLGLLQHQLEVQHRHQAPHSYDRLESLELSLEKEDYSPIPPFRALKTYDRRPNLMDSDRLEIRIYSESQLVEARLIELEQLQASGASSSTFAFESELLFIIRVLRAYNDELCVMLQESTHDFTGCYRRIAVTEYDLLETQAIHYPLGYLDPIAQRFRFRRNLFGEEKTKLFFTVRYFIDGLLRHTTGEGHKSFNYGARFRDRVVAVDMLHDPSIVQARLGELIHVLSIAYEEQPHKAQSQAVQIFQTSPGTISSISLLLLLEALLQGSDDPIIRKSLAWSLRISEDELDTLRFDEAKSDIVEHFEHLITTVGDKLIYKKSSGESGSGKRKRSGIMKRRGLAFRAACQTLRFDQNSFFLTQSLIFMILQGHTPTDLIKSLTNNKDYQKFFGLSFRETAKFLFQRPSSK